MFDKNGGVSFREYLEAKLDSIAERFKGMDKAIELQSNEMDRRLDVLNHAHQKSIEDRQSFVTQEIFEQIRREDQIWRNGVSNSISEAKGRAAALSAAYALVISVFISFVAMIIGHYWK